MNDFDKVSKLIVIEEETTISKIEGTTFFGMLNR